VSRVVRNSVAVVLLVLSFVALVPGLREPLITISASFSMMGRTMEVFRETRSILQTVESLHESGNDFVAGLIFLFGVVVPVVKGGLLLLALFASTMRRWVGPFVRAISKWAMNDVFIVAVYVSYLSAKATDALDAQIEPGFYWFAGYCLLSLLSLQFLQLQDPRETAP
jgi:paraquat-inducible protein A